MEEDGIFAEDEECAQCCQKRYCCTIIPDKEGELQRQYATKFADIVSTAHKIGKAFEYLLLIGAGIEMFFGVASFIFGLYLDYLRDEMALLSLADHQDSSTTQSTVHHNGIIHLLNQIPIFLITMGVLLVLFAAFGAAGALRHHLPFLWIYLSFLLIITLTQFFIIGAFMDNKELIATSIRDEFSTHGIRNYFDDTDIKNIIDYAQSTFKCCGSGDNGFLEWNNNIYFNCTTTNPSFTRCSVPSSCCINSTEELNNYCGLNVMSASTKNIEEKIYLSGCYQPVIDYMNSYQVIIVAIVGALAIAPIFEEVCLIVTIHVIKEEIEIYEYWKVTGTLPEEDIIRPENNGAAASNARSLRNAPRHYSYANRRQPYSNYNNMAYMNNPHANYT